MARLENVSLDDLHAALDSVTEKQPAQRLMVAILYKQGPSVPMIAEWFDLTESRIYRWFDRLESEPIAEAVYDRPRPGRPSKLSEEQLAAFREALQESPEAVGYDAETWTPAVARRFLESEFGVEYTRRHVRRLV